MIAAILKLFGLQPVVRAATLPLPRPINAKYYKNCIALRSRPATWNDEHQELLVEFDEPSPYIGGLPNPRRTQWMHDSWLTEVQ